MGQITPSPTVSNGIESQKKNRQNLKRVSSLIPCLRILGGASWSGCSTSGHEPGPANDAQIDHDAIVSVAVTPPR
jgi:hypothetical protein